MEKECKSLITNIKTSIIRLKVNSTGEFLEGIDSVDEIIGMHMSLQDSKHIKGSKNYEESEIYALKRLRELETNMR